MSLLFRESHLPLQVSGGGNGGAQTPLHCGAAQGRQPRGWQGGGPGHSRGEEAVPDPGQEEGSESKKDFLCLLKAATEAGQFHKVTAC